MDFNDILLSADSEGEGGDFNTILLTPKPMCQGAKIEPLQDQITQ